jgi:hypothetical protein
MHFKTLLNQTLYCFSLKRFYLCIATLFLSGIFFASLLFFNMPLFFPFFCSLSVLFLGSLVFIESLQASEEKELKDLFFELRPQLLKFGLFIAASIVGFVCLFAFCRLILSFQSLPIIGPLVFAFFSFLPFLTQLLNLLFLLFFVFFLFFFPPIFVMRNEMSYWIDLSIQKLKADSYLNLKLFFLASFPFALAFLVIALSFQNALATSYLSFISFLVMDAIYSVFLAPFLFLFYTFSLLAHLHLLKMIEEK